MENYTVRITTPTYSRDFHIIAPNLADAREWGKHQAEYAKLVDPTIRVLGFDNEPKPKAPPAPPDNRPKLLILGGKSKNIPEEISKGLKIVRHIQQDDGPRTGVPRADAVLIIGKWVSHKMVAAIQANLPAGTPMVTLDPPPDAKTNGTSKGQHALTRILAALEAKKSQV